MAENGGQEALGFAVLRGHEYMVLTTFRKDGRPVRTPVWFAGGISGEGVYVYTMGDSGKVKRIENNSGVLVGPSDARGGSLGQEVAGLARVLPPAEEGLAEGALGAKYGLKKLAFRLLVKILGRADRRVYLLISPDVDGVAGTPHVTPTSTTHRHSRRGQER